MKVNAAPTPPSSMRLARLTRGYTLLQVGARLDKDPAVIGKWERRLMDPPAEILDEMAELYGVDPQELL